MARGWESKSVEAQMESAKEQTSGGGKPSLSKEEKEIARLREGLVLSRKHVLQQIEASSNERYRQSLQRALNEIDEKLAKLDGNR
jgi:DNA-directed RNA polymerase sigma subunit (sigma70/sigma32)